MARKFRKFRPHIVVCKNGQKYMIEGGLETITSNLSKNVIWKIQSYPFEIISPEMHYKDGKIMRRAVYVADEGRYKDERKAEEDFIRNFNPAIYCNDLTGKRWCFDTKMPSGRWLENIEVVTNEKGITTFYAVIDALTIKKEN